MEWIIDNAGIVIALLCVGGIAGIGVYNFLMIPTDEQLNKVREWLLYAVSISEKELGSGTGQLKLRMVYGMFVDKFPWLVKALTFDKFSQLVDQALEKMNKMLDSNKAVKEFVDGGRD